MLLTKTTTTPSPAAAAERIRAPAARSSGNNMEEGERGRGRPCRAVNNGAGPPRGRQSIRGGGGAYDEGRGEGAKSGGGWAGLRRGAKLAFPGARCNAKRQGAHRLLSMRRVTRCSLSFCLCAQGSIRRRACLSMYRVHRSQLWGFIAQSQAAAAAAREFGK